MAQRKKTIALALLSLIVALTVSVFVWRAKAQTIINAGYDQFSTPANAVTQETLSLPEGELTNASGSPSVAFNGTITFQGGAAVSGYTGDTVIERTQNVTVPGSTPLQVIGLNLISVGTVTINFQDNTSVNYNVAVSQSTLTASTGSMSFASNGTFTNSLSVNVEYTFTAQGEPTAVIDAASIGIPAIAFNSSGSWAADGASDIKGRMHEDLVIGNTGVGGGTGSGSGGSPSGINVTIVPNTEQAILASHGIGPAPSPTPKGGCIEYRDPVTGKVHACKQNNN